MKKILVAYATLSGSTAEVAQVIGEEIAGDDIEKVVRHAGHAGRAGLTGRPAQLAGHSHLGKQPAWLIQRLGFQELSRKGVSNGLTYSRFH